MGPTELDLENSVYQDHSREVPGGQRWCWGTGTQHMGLPEVLQPMATLEDWPDCARKLYVRAACVCVCVCEHTHLKLGQ